MHTFAVYVDNKPGVLNRVSSLFRRRAFNIESLTVGHTETPGVSRMTVVVDTDERARGRLEAQPLQAVPVPPRRQHHQAPSISRDLAMIKVAATGDARTQVMQLVDVYRARIVDVSPESLVIETTGTEDKIDSLLEVLRPYGVIEMVRTGRVAMARGTAPTARAARAARTSWRPARGISGDVSSTVRCRLERIASRRLRVALTRVARSPSSPDYLRILSPERFRMATMYYDDAADLALIQGKKVGDHRLRIAGARARAEPEGQRRQRPGRPAGDQPVAREGAGGGARGRRRRRGAKWADVVMILVPDTSQAQDLQETIEPNLAPGNMLMFAHGFNIRFGTISRAAGRRRRDGGAEVARPPRPRAVRRRRRHAGAVRDPPGRDRQGARADAVLREGHRRHARRRHRDDVRRGDRDRSVRRAGGAVRRRQRAGQGRVRDAGRSRLSAGDRRTSSACTS